MSAVLLSAAALKFKTFYSFFVISLQCHIHDLQLHHGSGWEMMLQPSDAQMILLLLLTVPSFIVDLQACLHSTGISRNGGQAHAWPADLATRSVLL